VRFYVEEPNGIACECHLSTDPGGESGAFDLGCQRMVPAPSGTSGMVINADRQVLALMRWKRGADGGLAYEIGY
jgi:hypothetical protein